MDVTGTKTGIARNQLNSIRKRIYQGWVCGFLLASMLDFVIVSDVIPAYIWYPLVSGAGMFLFVLPFVIYDRINLALLQKSKD